MADMMSQLTELSSTAPDEPEETGIVGILQKMKSGIDDCGNMIDCYLKQKVIVRMVKSLSWQEKFESFAQKFSELKTRLNDAIFVIIHKSTKEINERAKASDEKLDQVLGLLKKRTDLEYQMDRYIQQHGGIGRCLEDDNLIQGLIAVSERRIDDPFPSIDYQVEPAVTEHHDRRRPTTRFVDDNYDGVYDLPQTRGAGIGSRRVRTRYAQATPFPPTYPSMYQPVLQTEGFRQPSQYPPGPAYPSMAQPVSQFETTRRPLEYPPPIPRATQPGQYVDLGLVTRCREEITVALNTGIDALLKNHSMIWKLKLDHQTAVITKEIRMGTSRILQKLDAGPHEGVSDPYLRAVWETEKWRGSVSGPVFVQAVRDYMSDCIESPGHPELVSDHWTLKFLGVSYRNALLEAIDIDHSSYVSVQEINKFTETKPAGHTLPVWLAYSIARYSYEAAHYKKEILNSIGALNRSAAEGRIAPAIVGSVHEYLSTLNNIVLEGLVYPLVVPPSRIRDIQVHEPLSVLLRSRMREREKDLAQKLSNARWEIDGAAALSAIIGEGPLEHHLLPLLYVFVNHYAESATKEIIPEGGTRNFVTGRETILKIAELVDDRVLYLRECFGPNEFPTFACGLFSFWHPIAPDGDSLPALSSEHAHALERTAIPGSYSVVPPPPMEVYPSSDRSSSISSTRRRRRRRRPSPPSTPSIRSISPRPTRVVQLQPPSPPQYAMPLRPPSPLPPSRSYSHHYDHHHSTTTMVTAIVAAVAATLALFTFFSFFFLLFFVCNFRRTV
ncbi:uncharacterized protein EI90DRAFT_3045091 [Cantharellus anzutake]|uniref:uncharacterized protein n=1 Tax=Cantharellus anzutake TaxID=1750568 RepID=UPI001905FFE2|nr:uncharacterized protein EI90DRAFT_3045091 [Cantharellus anzutake]KAF8336264.1 hypothetical protein EI90DRAFT_3045091 [Cantharellus anzutake]